MMKKILYGILYGIAVLWLGTAMFPVYAGTAQVPGKKAPGAADTAPAQAKTQSKYNACGDCHAARVDEIASAGGRHRNVPCIGCHYGHPPDVQKPFSSCNKCHLPTKKKHFKLSGLCLGCHRNPHTPLKITFKGQDDCQLCHERQVELLTQNTSKHTFVGCLGCHEVHRKVPQCGQCHSPADKPHFKLAGLCLGCHQDPHTPLKIAFKGQDDCRMCHSKQLDQLTKNKSKHTIVGCLGCHEVHRKVPQCTQCHKPHSEDMTADECKRCHKPHMPQVVTYDADTRSDECGACHGKAQQLLNASTAVHNGLECAECHQEKHKMVPRCPDCHGSPHPAGIMAKFPKCGQCHNIAHDLNHWPAGEISSGTPSTPTDRPMAPPAP